MTSTPTPKTGDLEQCHCLFCRLHHEGNSIDDISKKTGILPRTVRGALVKDGTLPDRRKSRSRKPALTLLAWCLWLGVVGAALAAEPAKRHGYVIPTELLHRHIPVGSVESYPPTTATRLVLPATFAGQDGRGYRVVLTRRGRGWIASFEEER